MDNETLRNPPAVSQGTQKFIAYFQIVLASLMSAAVVFVWFGLAIAVLAGTTFTVTSIASILVAQLLCVVLIFNFFEGGYREMRQLLAYSELAGNQPLITLRAQKIIAFGYLTLAFLSFTALAFHWYGLFKVLSANTVLSTENLAVTLVSELVCVALVFYLFVRGFNEKTKLDNADETE